MRNQYRMQMTCEKKPPNDFVGRYMLFALVFSFGSHSTADMALSFVAFQYGSDLLIKYFVTLRKSVLQILMHS